MRRRVKCRAAEASISNRVSAGWARDGIIVPGLMRIIVLGAGAIGSIYGARLSKYHDVTLIGGASHVAAIQRDGLVMQGHTAGTLRLPAFTTVPAIEPGTLILLTTKVNNNVAAVRADRRACCRRTSRSSASRTASTPKTS